MSRGGKRPGAGRKPAPPDQKRASKGIRLPVWLWEKIDALGYTRSSVVEEAILAAFGWDEEVKP